MATENINAPDFLGRTQLYMAVLENNLKNVKELIAAGADINKGRTDNGTNPLYLASKRGNLEIVKLLIATGADINKARTDVGETPLFIACEFGHLGIVQALIAAGADINKARTDNGNTPLFIACENGHLEIVKVLIAAGADVNKVKPNTGMTPLEKSAMNKHYEIVVYLVENGADINKIGYKGTSFLQKAQAYYFSPEINDYILSKQLVLNQNNINKPNSNVFNVFMAMNSPFNNVYQDQDNLIFKVGDSFFAYPREQIEKELKDKSGIRYECKKEIHGAPFKAQVAINKPYYLLKGNGMYMISVVQIKKAIQKKEDRFYELIETDEIKPFTASYRSVQHTPGRNQSGNPISIVSADHCQAGSSRRVYNLKKLNIKEVAAAAPGAGVPQGGRRKMRKTKKAKKGSRRR
jgi:ankyrin repeat protein